MLKLLFELVRKDVIIFFSDRRALLISFMVPVFIASFLAMLTSNASTMKPTEKIPVLVAVEDSADSTKSIMERLKQSTSIIVVETDRSHLEEQVQAGKYCFGVVLPKGFGDAATEAMGSENQGPKLLTYTDPARATESQIARMTVYQSIMGGVVKAKYGSLADPGKMPFQEEKGAVAKVKSSDESYNGISHAFAGMGMQGLLFWAIESAMVILRERKLGIWRRLRASPVSPAMLLCAKLLSGAIRALAVLVVVFLAGALIFHLTINGSILGFALIAILSSVMASSFGLFVAALGKTEQQSRGLSILAVLVMMMLGGGWFPIFLMPKWVQNLSMALPVRWSVDGFDSMMWRAEGLERALPSAGALIIFTAIFGLVALRRIRWEYEA